MQMLRGAEMLFAAIFSVVFLKRTLNRNNYIGIGCCLVGCRCIDHMHTLRMLGLQDCRMLDMLDMNKVVGVLHVVSTTSTAHVKITMPVLHLVCRLVSVLWGFQACFPGKAAPQLKPRSRRSCWAWHL